MAEMMEQSGISKTGISKTGKTPAPDAISDDEASKIGPGLEALLLDRDGVINVDRGYVYQRDKFEWREGIFRLVKIAVTQAIPVVVVTNQSGIGRGYYLQDDYDKLTTWMCEVFAQRGTPLTRVYHCPFHPDARIAALRDSHPWRKPEPGMILAAKQELNLDLGRSVMIGDQWSDALAAWRAGVGTAVLVGEQRPPEPEILPPFIRQPDMVAVADWYAARRAKGASSEQS